MADPNSLERIVPDQLDEKDIFDRETFRLHTERYDFAIQHGDPGAILDMACGTGYGAYQIIQSEKFANSHVTAVDIDADTIAYCNKRYSSQQIHFVCADVMTYTSPVLFDTIVSLETVEHLKKPGLFIQKLQSHLKKDGILIISAPVTPSTDGNPHHLADFSATRFKKLFLPGFLLLSEFLQVQPYTLPGLFRSKNKRLAAKRKDILKYYLQHPGVFFARIQSLFVDGLTNKYLTLVLRKR
jgi:2-polyprenyl-3-methyl-5-hydroxy-6-metoxy-1,4-benzoquinol methylase